MKSVTCLGHLWDQYTSLGTQTLAPKNTFRVFFFQLYFNKKYVKVTITDFTIHLIFLKWLRIQKCKQKRETMRKRGRKARRNCQQNCFHSCNYVIDQVNVCFVFYRNSLHCFVWFHLYYLLHLLSSDCFTALTNLWPYKFFISICEFLKNYCQGVHF